MSGKSESGKERKCKRSACWYFYDKTPGGGFCRICQKEILTQGGGTTNLRNHLRRRHNELWIATMENRLDPSTLSITDRPSSSLILSEKLENQSSTLKLSMAPQQPVKDNSVDFTFYTNNEGIAASEEEVTETVAETNSAVHTIQAYRDVNGTTFLYLHPAPEGETSVQVQNAQFQPVVASSETITTNGELVTVAVQKESSVLEGQAEGDAKTQEEVTPKKLVHAPVKNYQGSSVASRTVVRQMARPNPVKMASPVNCNNNYSCNKEDSYDAFGKYIASMLRNLPSKTACKLQGEIVNWILKEQMKNN